MHKNEDFERSKFMEGASWMGQKSLAVCNKMVDGVEQMVGEYNARTQQTEAKSGGRGEMDPLYVSRTQAWLVENVEKLTQESRDEVQGMLERSLSNMEASKKKVSHVLGASSY